MIADLPPTKFARLLDGIWKRRGWQTNVKARDNGSFLVMGRRENGTLGLLYVLPGAEREVDASTFSQFRGLAQKKGAQVAVVATQGSFVEQVRSGADEAGVHLLAPNDVRDAVREGGFEDLLSELVGREVELGETGSGPGGAGDDSGAADGQPPGRADAAGAGGDDARDDPPLPEPLSAVADRLPDPALAAVASAWAAVDGMFDSENVPDPLAPASGDDGGSDDGEGGSLASSLPLGRRALAAVAVLVAVVVVGGVLGVGGPLDGVAASDAPDSTAAVTVLSTTERTNATLTATWNARTADTVELENGTSYDAPDGETFVVVQLNVTNQEVTPVQLSQEDLALEAGGTRYGYQPLAGAETFRGGVFIPGETTSVWTAFSVPENTTAGTVLIVPEGNRTVQVAVEHDPSLQVEAVP